MTIDETLVEIHKRGHHGYSASNLRSLLLTSCKHLCTRSQHGKAVLIDVPKENIDAIVSRIGRVGKPRNTEYGEREKAAWREVESILSASHKKQKTLDSEKPS